MQKVFIWGTIIIVLIAVIVLLLNKADKSKDIAQPNEIPKMTQPPTSTPTPTPFQNKTLTPPEMTLDPKKTYIAKLSTSEGDITIELFANKTPKTVNNFVYLANRGFYDGTIFHRVMKDFMIQGGDPKGDGTGGPGYKFDDEPFDGEYARGTVAMANSGPNTNGSQFFIMHKDNALPKNYVIFGKVTSGIEVVDKIAEAPVKVNSYTREVSSPVNPVTVNKVEITEK
jgi:cyclophilin family peptidyl-prolyl cis-trans isomerase